jgi:uncharacterized membrane protein
MSVDQNNHVNSETQDAPLLPTINKVDAGAPLQWLKLGWQDMRATHFYGLFYGVVFVFMGWAITWVYATRWQLTMGLLGGFFLMGPFICTGLYELSRQYEKEGKANLFKSMVCWCRNIPAIAFFAIVLTFAMIVWARVSLVIFALFSNTIFPSLQGLLGEVFALSNPIFLLAWLGIGFVFASIIFAISVISVPLMLDRNSDIFIAMICSARALLINPCAMYLWALAVLVIIGASLLLGFLPLIVTAPLVGHATWHAYRALVT